MLAVFQRRELAERVPGRRFEVLGGFHVGHAVCESDVVVEAEFLEEPGYADAARGLEEPEGYGGHGWARVRGGGCREERICWVCFINYGERLRLL